MNKKFSLHFRIYTRLPLDDRKTAERLCKKFVSFGGDFVPTSFSANEPIRTEFDPQDVAKPATLLSETSHHLLLKRLNPRWLAHFYWHRGRTRPWFWTFDFGEEWTKGDKPEQIVDFLTDLCADFPPVFAAGGLSADWFDKHDVTDPDTGEFRESAGASFNPGTGLPGIYWFNFFGKEPVAHFGRAKLLQLDGLVIKHEGSDGVGVLAYEAPDQRDPAWRRARERQIVEALGEQYFFNLEKAAGKRPRRRAPIPGATDAKSLRG
jgi:hypothetical protein